MATAGQPIQFRWRMGSDGSVGATGWYVDTVSLSTPTCCGDVAPPVAFFNGTPTSGGAPLTVTFTDSSFGSVTNRFWDFGNGVTSNTTATTLACTYPVAGMYTVSLTVSGPFGSNTYTRGSYITVTNTQIQLVTNGYTLLSEGCVNGGIDPGETVSLNLTLRNAGSASTTNLVATLLPSGGITLPSGPQTYGALLAGGGAVSRAFSFTATGSCGATDIATLHLQDGPLNLGTVAFTLPLGQLGPLFAEAFDGVTSPALPAGWTTTASGAQSSWTTLFSTVDTAPNAAYSPDPIGVGVNELVTPNIALPSGPAQLRFRHSYNLEANPNNTTAAYDGGVLEIKIGAGTFQDILVAGGTFVAGNYTRTISTGFSNPLAGRPAWSGSTSGFTNVILNLPASVGGQSIQLRWRCGSDVSIGAGGWFVDTISILTPTCCATPAPPVLSSPRLSNGVFGMTILGSPGANYLVESSTNLHDWSAAGSLSNATGSVPFSDTNAPRPFRAYRARLLP